jgi:hypothetical protein
MLAAMALCDSLRDSIQHDIKELNMDSCSSLSNEPLGSAFPLNRPSGGPTRHMSNNSQEEFARLRGPQRAAMEPDYTLREVLDTIFSKAMAHDVIHEVYEPRMERVDIRAVIESLAYSEMVSRFPGVTYPIPFPSLSLTLNCSSIFIATPFSMLANTVKRGYGTDQNSI